MLTVGTDSYVTVAEADEYISKRYTSNSKDRKRWEELSKEDKEIIIRNACDEIELMPFQGRKITREQKLEFPRLPYQYGNPVVPDIVKYAQIELALWLSDDKTQLEQSQRRDLQAQGVESFSIGDLSESYASGNAEQSAPLLCSKCAALLKPYLRGGYETC